MFDVVKSSAKLYFVFAEWPKIGPLLDSEPRSWNEIINLLPHPRQVLTLDQTILRKTSYQNIVGKGEEVL